MNSISERINYVCELKNFSHRELAVKLGVTSSAIYNIISGKTKKPGADILLGFEKLGISSSWLLSGNGSMEIAVDFKKDISIEYLIRELEQKDSLIKTLQNIVDSQLLLLGKWLDVSYSQFVFFVSLKYKFRYIMVMI